MTPSVVPTLIRNQPLNRNRSRHNRSVLLTEIAFRNPGTTTAENLFGLPGVNFWSRLLTRNQPQNRNWSRPSFQQTTLSEKFEHRLQRISFGFPGDAFYGPDTHVKATPTPTPGADTSKTRAFNKTSQTETLKRHFCRGYTT